MQNETQSTVTKSLVRAALTGSLLFTTRTAVLNLPGGHVEVIGRALILDGDSLTLTVPSGGVTPVDGATPDASGPIDPAAP